MCEAAAGRPGSQPPGVRGCRPQPGALGAWCTRVALSQGGQATAGGALHLPFPSLSQSAPCWSPWQCASHRPLSPPQGHLGPRCKGKAGAELRPGRRQWRLPASRSLLLPGRKRSSEASLGKARPGHGSLATATLPHRASEQSWSSAVLEANSAPAKQGLSDTRLGCLLFPRGGSPPRLLFTRLPGGGALRLLQVLAQGLLALSWG